MCVWGGGLYPKSGLFAVGWLLVFSIEESNAGFQKEPQRCFLGFFLFFFFFAVVVILVSTASCSLAHPSQHTVVRLSKQSLIICLTVKVIQL